METLPLKREGPVFPWETPDAGSLEGRGEGYEGPRAAAPWSGGREGSLPSRCVAAQTLPWVWKQRPGREGWLSILFTPG